MESLNVLRGETKTPKNTHPQILYEKGRGVTQNYQDARRLYALASAQGQVNAAKYLKDLEEKIHAECPLLGNQVVVTRTTRSDLNGKTGAVASFDQKVFFRFALLPICWKLHFKGISTFLVALIDLSVSKLVGKFRYLVLSTQGCDFSMFDRVCHPPQK